MHPIIQLLQTPIALYAVVLTISWTFIQVITKTDFKGFNLNISNYNGHLLSTALILYVTLTVVLVNVNLSLFPYLHAAMLALAILSIVHSPGAISKSLLTATLIVALMPVLVMISARHPLPLGDDARFIGFATAIANDGRWVPFKYYENPYYQFFHLIPALEYILASITGVGTANVMIYYLTLKLTLYSAYFVLIFLVVKKLAGSPPTPFLAVLLLSITPPLALTQVVHQGYAIVLTLASLLTLLNTFRASGRSSRADVLAGYPLWLAGLIAHATYTIMFLAFSLPLILINEFEDERRKIIRTIGSILVISLAYWIHTYVMDIIVRPAVNALDRLTDLITGRLSPFHEAAQPWYGPQEQIFFISWALVPSIAASYVITFIPTASSMVVFYAVRLVKHRYPKEVLKGNRSVSTSLRHYLSILGLLGLGGTVINYMLRALPTFGGRYFYWLYLLMIPLSASVVEKLSKKLLSLIFCVALISLVSFYGIQDPTLSANTYHDTIGWADRTSWSIGMSLNPYIDPKVESWLDPRIGAPVSALTPLTLPSSGAQVLAVIGLDEVGITAMQKDPRNVDWFKRNFGIGPDEFIGSIDNYTVVFNSGKYMGVWKHI